MVCGHRGTVSEPRTGPSPRCQASSARGVPRTCTPLRSGVEGRPAALACGGPGDVGRGLAGAAATPDEFDPMTLATADSAAGVGGADGRGGWVDGMTVDGVMGAGVGHGGESAGRGGTVTTAGPRLAQVPAVGAAHRHHARGAARPGGAGFGGRGGGSRCSAATCSPLCMCRPASGWKCWPWPATSTASPRSSPTTCARSTFAADPGVDTVEAGDLDDLEGHRRRHRPHRGGRCCRPTRSWPRGERRVGEERGHRRRRDGARATLPRGALVGGVDIYVVGAARPDSAEWRAGGPEHVQGWVPRGGPDPTRTPTPAPSSWSCPSPSPPPSPPAAAEDRLSLVVLEG